MHEGQEVRQRVVGVIEGQRGHHRPQHPLETAPGVFPPPGGGAADARGELVRQRDELVRGDLRVWEGGENELAGKRRRCNR